ncbi:MAG: family 43 glycosylhydrolase [Ferruginibacter sp.]|nr:family 43 glycosylhydrolase [Cytophagales bacterium]
MKKTATFLTLLLGLLLHARAQFKVDYNPGLQPNEKMQYFTPAGENLFVGDCIPFAHNGTYYLYWLIDQGHHTALNGYGGHQWVLSTTTDLKQWTHHPVVLGIDEEWEKSICTGSLVHANNQFYAFYATRLVKDGKTNEQLSYAVSDDGIHFKKQQPNPFFTAPPGYSGRDFRDPKAVVDSDGVFNLFVSSRETNAPLQGQDGCLVRVASRDLKKWEVNPPVLTGQNSVPECPDYFRWNGWYYLVYSNHGDTYYVKSRSQYGPWQYPRYQALKEEMSNVAKTAEFAGQRRIAAAWVPSRKDNQDQGKEIFGGSAVFREVIQLEDGTLGTRFPAEMTPETGAPLPLPVFPAATNPRGNADELHLNSPNGLGAAHFEKVPVNCRITLEIEPLGDNEEYGLHLRSNEKASAGYKLNFSANARVVSLGNTRIEAVEGLNKPTKIEVIMAGDIIDVCVDGKRCIINRTPEQKGSFLWLYAKHGNVKFKSIKIAALKEKS